VRVLPSTASSTLACSQPTATIYARSCAGNASDDEIGDFLSAVWAQRADRYSEARSDNTRALPKIEMSYIGG
jgi:hypothetical protein